VALLERIEDRLARRVLGVDDGVADVAAVVVAAGLENPAGLYPPMLSFSPFAVPGAPACS